MPTLTPIVSGLTDAYAFMHMNDHGTRTSTATQAEAVFSDGFLADPVHPRVHAEASDAEAVGEVVAGQRSQQSVFLTYRAWWTVSQVRSRRFFHTIG